MAAAATTEEIRIRSGDFDVPAYLARPEGPAPHPAIIVIHEVWGLVDHIRDVARRFAAEGYVTLAPDLFARQGGPGPLHDREAIMKAVGSIPDAQGIADLRAGVAYLRGRPDVNPGAIGSIGYCMGGAFSLLLAAHEPALRAAADYYGRVFYAQTNELKPRSPIEFVPQLHCPLLGVFGALDPGIPPDHAEALRQALQQHRKPGEVIVYPEAGHAFFNDSGPNYHGASAADAWRRTLDFFARHLRPR